MQKPKILFVPGAWHWEFHVDPWLPFLTQLGYETKVLVLTNNVPWEAVEQYQGEGYEDSVNQIVQAMLEEARAGRDFISIGHSASGLINAEGINRFLASATPEEKSHLKYHILVASFLRLKHFEPSWQHFDVEKNLAFPVATDRIFFNDLLLTEAKPFVYNLRPVVWDPKRPDMVADDWKQIPTKYILCTRDNAYIPEWAYEECADFKLDYVEYAGDHCPFATTPKEFAEFVDKLLIKEKVVAA